MPVETSHDGEFYCLDVPDGDCAISRGCDADGDLLSTVELNHEVQARHCHDLEDLAWDG